VNRTFRDKPGAWSWTTSESPRACVPPWPTTPIVTESGKRSALPSRRPWHSLEENHEICCELLYGCPWREALESGTDRAKLEAIQEALDHLFGREDMDLPDRFRHHVRVATQSFALAVSLPEAMAYRDDLAFFQAVAVGLRADDRGGVSDDVELETALRQVVSDAITSAGVIDIYEGNGDSKAGPQHHRRAVHEAPLHRPASEPADRAAAPPTGL